jgi:hypothetical protein
LKKHWKKIGKKWEKNFGELRFIGKILTFYQVAEKIKFSWPADQVPDDRNGSDAPVPCAGEAFFASIHSHAPDI